MISENIKGYIFDLDGTLFDSAWVWKKVDTLFLSRRGFALPDDYAKKVSVLGFKAAAVYTKERFGLKESPSDIISEWSEMSVELFSSSVELFDGAYEYLSILKSKGKKLGIATASHDELFVPVLKRCKVYDMFDSITTVYDVSRGKEFPDIYEKATQRLDLSPHDCVVFEDALPALKAAKSIGCYTVAFLSEDNESEQDELIKLSDKTIESYGELL